MAKAKAGELVGTQLGAARDELMALTKKELLEKFADVPGVSAKLNKPTIVELGLGQSIQPKPKQVEEQPQASKGVSAEELSYDEALAMTRVQLAAALVSAELLSNAEAASMNKQKLLEFGWGEEHVRPSAGQGLAVDDLLEGVPMLREFLDYLAVKLEDTGIDVPPVVRLCYVAVETLRDCRLRDGKQASVALHVPISAHNRRFRTVLRRLVFAEWPNEDRHFRFAILSSTFNSLPEFFPKSAEGVAMLDDLWSEVEDFLGGPVDPPRVPEPDTPVESDMDDEDSDSDDEDE